MLINIYRSKLVSAISGQMVGPPPPQLYTHAHKGKTCPAHILQLKMSFVVPFPPCRLSLGFLWFRALGDQM